MKLRALLLAAIIGATALTPMEAKPRPARAQHVKNRKAKKIRRSKERKRRMARNKAPRAKSRIQRKY